MTADDRRRAIGKVISVAADRFVVELHGGIDSFTVVGFDDVHYVANLGSFLVIPVQSEYVVAEVVGLREKDPTAGRIGREEGGELDKAASAKYLDLVPVGMLPQHRDRMGKFRFGVSAYPSLYADALYALDSELDRIFDVEEATGDGPTAYRALAIGKSVVFQGYDVKVKVDEFFGGHAAVLGNTGSGKSCTVATILQSLFAKPDEYRARGATFVVFDVNGEYKQAFEHIPDGGQIGVKHLVLDGTADSGRFRLPHWFLEVSEWELLLRASEKTQIPVLRTALGLTSLESLGNATDVKALKQHFVATCILECFRGSDGDSPVSKIQRVWSLLDKYGTKGLDRNLLKTFGCDEQFGNFKPPFPDRNTPSTRQTEFLECIKKFIKHDVKLPSYRSQPFGFGDFEECLDFAILYEEAHGNRQIRDYCSQMMTRLKSLGERSEFEFLRHIDKKGITQGNFMQQILGLEPSGNGLVKRDQIVIIDMNSVDDEIVELVAAVVSRMIFRTLRFADPRNSFPVHLVLEEAHRYIAEHPTKYAIDASRIFERIAKEGRKYGLFLTVASQRPSELSKTVLSQCSNFVVHRIQNPDDLAHIRQMTPFISDSVLKRLPSLPKQHALVFGNAVNLPTTFRVRDASPTPESADADIRELWFHEAGRLAQIRLPISPSSIGTSCPVNTEEDDEIPF